MTARLSFRNLFARTPRTARKPAPPRARLGLEALEDRTTPSVTGTVVAWGANAAGEASVPAGLSGVTEVDGGAHHSLAVKSDGTVVAWGYNADGQASVPDGLSGMTEVAAGVAHSLAVKSDGTVVAWGYNGDGQASVPAGLSGVVHVAAGAFHSLAVKSDGTVVAWGYNELGQASVPAGLSGVTKVAAGYAHNLAVKSDGTVVAWGSNRAGQASVPAGLSGVAEVAAGYAHSLALVATNQAPVVTAPSATQTAYEDVDKAISGITVGDPDGNSLTVTLAVGHGKLTLGTTAGLTVTGNGTGSVTLAGSIANLNAALASLVYRGALNFSGGDALAIAASDGSLSTSGSVAIHVKSVAEQVADLQAQIQALRQAGVLNDGQAEALNLNLRDNNGDAGKVQAFLNQVAAFLQGGVLTQAEADSLAGLGNILLLSVTRR